MGIVHVGARTDSLPWKHDHDTFRPLHKELERKYNATTEAKSPQLEHTN